MTQASESKIVSRPLLIGVLALGGLAVSTYLLTVHWGWWSAVCLGVGDCELVNTSRYSEFLGTPVALFGMGAYVALLALGAAVLREVQAEWARRGLFAIAAVGVAFSIYLTYIELFVLHEFWVAPHLIVEIGFDSFSSASVV